MITYEKSITFGMLSLILFGAIAPPITAVVKANEMDYSSTNTDYVSKNGVRIYLIDGEMFEIPADEANPTAEQMVAMKQERGRWLKVAKLLLKIYNKFPGWVKGLLSYSATNTLSKTLEKFSGTLEDGLTKGLESLGFSHDIAREMSKDISWVLF